MKRDLKSFAGIAQKTAEKIGDQAAADQLKRFQGKSEEELLSELMREVSRGRAEGTFTEERLKEMSAQVSPMLNAEQKKRLQEVLARLK